MSDKSVVIVSGTRTPVGSLGGCLASVKSAELGAIVIKEALLRANLKGEDVSEVIFGQVLTAGQGQNPCRQAALKAGVPETVPAYLINMLCGSGLKSVFLGYQAILCGSSDVVVCGGQESMSQAPHVALVRPGVKLGNMTLSDTILQDGLVDTIHNIHMGVTAENISKKYNISRLEQDEFATSSQNKAEEALKLGYFDKEMTPVEISARTPTIVTVDEFPKSGTTVERLSKLKPVFDKQGTVTAGNASGINDGAAAVVLMDSKIAKSKGLKPLATIRGIAQVGVDPLIMGIGPVSAVKSVLSKVGWTIDDVDLFEINEAFASQAIAVARELGIKSEKLNVCGGAIALGHPVGASGCRVLVTLLHTLERLQKSKGVASLCVGGGMGVAIAVERI